MPSGLSKQRQKVFQSVITLIDDSQMFDPSGKTCNYNAAECVSALTHYFITQGDNIGVEKIVPSRRLRTRRPYVSLYIRQRIEISDFREFVGVEYTRSAGTKLVRLVSY